MSEKGFGRALLTDFSFGKDYVNLNHGSFGTYPRVVKHVIDQWTDRIEQAPDVFMRIEVGPELEKVRGQLAELVNCDTDELVLVPNATTGVNVVLRSLSYEEQGRDTILYFSTIYGACGNTVEYLVDSSNGRIKSVEIPLAYPLTDDAILEKFEQALEQHKNRVKVAVIDHISSLPGVLKPWKQLVNLCKKHGVLSLVDGAHGIGIKQLDLKSADPDFFISNCHKWLHCKRPTAILFVAHRNHDSVHAMPTTHGYQSTKRKHQLQGKSATNGLASGGTSAFVAEFAFPSTLDFAPYLAIPAAIEYRKSLGGEVAVIEYCEKLASEGGALVADILGTEVLEGSGPCAMVNIRMPLDYKRDCKRMDPGLRMTWFHRYLYDKYNLATSPLVHNNTWWLRLSAQVYNDLDDFKYCGETIKEVCAAIERGDI
ncbi:hypothetical protein PYCC9005_004788 [Savitreella phatthalungensis]